MPGDAMRWEEALRNAPDEYVITTHVRRYQAGRGKLARPREQIVKRSIFSIDPDSNVGEIGELLYMEDMVVVPLKTA